MPKFREERIRDNMTEKEKMLAGKIYDPSDKTLDELRVKAHRLSQMYNNTYDTMRRNARKSWRNWFQTVGKTRICRDRSVLITVCLQR